MPFRRFTLFATATLLAAVSLVGCASPGETSGGAEPVRIGAILSLTGSYAALGESEKNALELETERINTAGGIDGRELELIIADDATDEAKAVAAATKLIDQDGVVALIGATGTGQTMAVRETVNRAGIPQISMAGGTVVTKEFDPLVFQTPWSNTIVVPFVLEKVKADGHSKIAVLSDSGGYGKDGLAILRETVGGAGLEIVAEETFNPGDADMTAQLTKIKNSGAQAVVMWTAGKEAVTVMKNAESLGILAGEGALPFYGGSGQVRVEFAKGAGSAADGFVFGTGRSLVPENWGQGTPAYEAVSGFAARYSEAYKEQPDIFAGHAFDAVTLLADALGRVEGEVDGASLRDALEQTSGVVGFGGTFTFSPTDHNGLTTEDLSLYTFEGGAWKPLK